MLTGCMTAPPLPAPDDGAGQAAQRRYRETIALSGRLSVRYQQNGNDEAIHGNFNWVQHPEYTRITLLSPLGQTVAVIEVRPGMSTLLQSGQPPRTAENADALVAGALGWPLPVAGLKNWLQGFAIDSQGRQFVAARSGGRDSVTTQDGWWLHYVTWHDNGDQQHPRRIDLERSTVQAGEVAIRIVIDTWQAG